MTTSEREKVLQSAISATVGDRNKSYGAPTPNLTLQAAFVDLYQKASGGKYHPAHDAAITMVFAKLARIACGAKGHRDNYVDAAAYMAIAYECEALEERTPSLAEALDKITGMAQTAFVVEDPINTDTRLPEAKSKPVAEYAPPLAIAPEGEYPPVDSDSPFSEMETPHLIVRLGEEVLFEKGGDLWKIVRIEASGLVTAANKKGRTINVLARHFHARVIGQ